MNAENKTQDRLCAHSGCPCPADPGSDYCSEECRALDGARQTPCPCKHDLCRQAQETRKTAQVQKGVHGSLDPQTQKEDEKKPLLDDWGRGDKH